MEDKKEAMIKMAEEFAPSYLDALKEASGMANNTLNRITSLLIAIAFSSIALSLQLISNPNLEVNIIRWGLILLIISVLFGFLQMIIDLKYWNKSVKMYRDIATNFKVIATGNFKESNFLDLRNALAQAPKNDPNLICVWLEGAFLLIGGIMILTQIML